MLQGALFSGAGRKELLAVACLRPRFVSKGGVRCQVAGASSSSQGAASEPDTPSPSASGRIETVGHLSLTSASCFSVICNLNST